MKALRQLVEKFSRKSDIGKGCVLLRSLSFLSLFLRSATAAEAAYK